MGEKEGRGGWEGKREGERERGEGGRGTCHKKTMNFVDGKEYCI